MVKNFEDLQQVSKENVDVALKVHGRAVEGHPGDRGRGRRLFEEGLRGRHRRAREAVRRQVVRKAIEVQTEYAKTAYEGFVAKASKIGELYADLAKETYKPFEILMAKAK